MNNNKYLETAIKSAKIAGEEVLSLYKKIKKLILSEFPKHSFLSEESGLYNKKSNYLWIIDPLDGTVNYTKGIKICSISISLKYKNNFVLGVIYNPFTNDIYYASKNNGAFLNGDKILVSKNKNLNDSLFIAAFSSEKEDNDLKEYKKFRNINTNSLGVLRLGSAAYSLGLLSEGSIDGFWAKKAKIWDIAAGICIVEEAGGKALYKFFSKNKISIIAGNKNITNKLNKELKLI